MGEEKLAALLQESLAVATKNQSYRRVGRRALIAHQRYAHAHQFKRANKALRKLKTYAGRVIRDIARKTADHEALGEVFAWPLSLTRRVLEQNRHPARPQGLFPACPRG